MAYILPAMTPAEIEAAFETARADVRAADLAYQTIRTAYYAHQIGDEEFLAGRRAHKAAEAAYDAAFAAMQTLPDDDEETPAPTEPTTQLELI